MDTLVAHVYVKNVAVYTLAQGRVTLPTVTVTALGELNLQVRVCFEYE